MTERAICFECIEDAHLRATVERDGVQLLCESCGGEDNKAFSYERLGKEMEPIIREHFQLGPTVKKFYDDDSEGWEQEGDPLSYIVSEVLRQDVENPDELVSAICDAEEYWPSNGEDAFYDSTSQYVRRRATTQALVAEWQHLRDELAHRRRFFSDGARALFDRLFKDVAELKTFDREAKKWLPVINTLPAGTEVFRARVVRSDAELKSFVCAPVNELSAPPADRAQAGRMNAAGIAVFYGAMSYETCLAEMRPALGGRVLVGAFRTTQALRILDFRSLESARGTELSFFDSMYADHLARAAFLRRLHCLISRPVVPGSEGEYLITQTLTEYLAHVHRPEFDGVIFQSVQREGGANIVLFGRDGFAPMPDTVDGGESKLPMCMPPAPGGEMRATVVFPVEYVADSVKLYVTRSIEYAHDELPFSIEDDRLFVHDFDRDGDIDEDE